MPESLTLTFETGELLRRARANGRAIALLAIAFAKERGMLDEFIAYVGPPLARSWNGLDGASTASAADALVIVRAMAADLVALGARVHTLTGGDGEAEVVVVGWPEPEALALAGLSERDADRMLTWYDAIAEELGMHFRAQREGDELTLRIYR